MESFEVILLLMSVAVLLVGLAQKIHIPYPIALVCGGALIGFIPGLDGIHFDPNLILVIVLPPILYYAAVLISFREFKHNFRQIFSLAIGLVIVTTLSIGLVFKWIFPEYPWSLAFAFGAIISPPDAAAATTVLKRFKIGTRVLAVLEGESLVNDASALVLYRLAIIALLSGTFSFGEAGIEFGEVVFGGVAMGITMGLITQTFSKHLLDPIVGVIFSFTIPYMTYILADFFEFSGVLAVVANGLIGSRVLMTHSSSLRRVVGVATWDIFIILLNCFVFILIGAQLGTIISEMSSKEFHLYIAYGVMITLMVMALRMAWVYIECSIAYYRGEKRPQMFKEAALIGWSGMRAIVSLAAALALPFTLSDGTPLPGRDDVIFMTFVVIMLSLLVPGLSLPVVIKWLKISHHSEHDSKHGTAATLRKQLAHIAEKEIHRLHAIAHLNDEEKEFFTHYFHARQRVYETPNVNPQQDSLHSTRINILRVQREQLLKMWKNREIDDMHLRLLGRELDIEESLSARAEIN